MKNVADAKFFVHKILQNGAVIKVSSNRKREF